MPEHTSHKHYAIHEIIQYIEGGGDAMWRKELELQAAEDPFLADAIEGLSSIPEQEKVKKHTQQLNQFIKANTKPDKIANSEAEFPGFIYIAIVIILLLVVAAWYVIYYSK